MRQGIEGAGVWQDLKGQGGLEYEVQHLPGGNVLLWARSWVKRIGTTIWSPCCKCLARRRRLPERSVQPCAKLADGVLKFQRGIPKGGADSADEDHEDRRQHVERRHRL
jgi:hypothetical protein